MHQQIIQHHPHDHCDLCRIATFFVANTSYDEQIILLGQNNMQALIVRFVTASCIFAIPVYEVWGKSCAEHMNRPNPEKANPKFVSYDDCVKQARATCEQTAHQRKLIDAAKDTFMKRCLAEAIGK